MEEIMRTLSYIKDGAILLLSIIVPLIQLFLSLTTVSGIIKNKVVIATVWTVNILILCYTIGWCFNGTK